MTPATGSPSPVDDAPVTIATFPNPHEAELAHAALDSRGIESVVHNDHGQYLSAGSWVQLQVSERDRERASILLEQGPIFEAVGADGVAATDVAEMTDDLVPLRVARRTLLARWFLYAGALMFLLTGFLLPLAVIALALALWSKRSPRRAFGVACGLQTLVAFGSVATPGLVGLISTIPLIAFYFAWAVAKPTPEPSLVASPYSRMRSVAIGDGWKTGVSNDLPATWPIWVVRDLGWFLLALAIVSSLSVVLRPG